MKTNEDIEKEIHKLLLDPDFEDLQNLLTEEVDFMSILGVRHRELQHSNILGWLFNPNENHGLGDYLLRAFIKRCFIKNNYESIGASGRELSIIQFDELDLDDITVQREHKNIDLLVTSNDSNFILVIENKIFSTEGGDQLTRYRNYAEENFTESKHLLFVYLSLFEQTISEEEQGHYLQITYEEIKLILVDLISNKRIQLKNNIRFIVEQYLKSLQAIMNDNKELEDLCKKVYRKYKVAFDEVIKYNMSSGYGKVPHDLVDYINERKEIGLFKTNKSFVRFQPDFLKENDKLLHDNNFLSESESIDDSWLFLYEFNIGKDFINFDFKIGISEIPEARQRLFAAYLENDDAFSRANDYKGRLYEKWHMCFQEKILTKAEYEKLIDDPDELAQHIKVKFDNLLDNQIPQIDRVIKKVTGINLGS